MPLYMVDDFRDRFRMDRDTFDVILEQLTPRLLIGDRNCPVKISAEKQLLIYIKYVATQMTIQTLSDLFGVCEATIFRLIRKISGIICKDVMPDVIKWPSGQKIHETLREFENLKGFPGVIGAIDGSHIPIRTPKQNPENYINRKCFPSVVLQAVCDANMHILDLHCGWPGSVHDSRVLKNSPLFSHAQEWFPGNTHLLGDSAYPLQTWLLTPFKDYGNLNPDQKKYNYLHSSTRMAIERTFGSLKGRFRRLKYVDMLDIEEIVKLVLSICTLHELCLLQHDVYSSDEIEDEVNDFQYILRESRTAELKRNEIMQQLNSQ